MKLFCTEHLKNLTILHILLANHLKLLELSYLGYYTTCIFCKYDRVKNSQSPNQVGNIVLTF